MMCYNVFRIPNQTKHILTIVILLVSHPAAKKSLNLPKSDSSCIPAWNKRPLSVI